MTPDQILAGVVGAVVEVAGVDPADVVPGASFADLGIDSLTLVEVVVATEQMFDVRVSAGDLAGLRTVADVIAWVQMAAAAAAGA